MIWSLCAAVNQEHHEALNIYIRDRFSSILFPNVDTVYSYFLDIQNNTELSFKHWNDKTPEFNYDPTLQFF